MDRFRSSTRTRPDVPLGGRFEKSVSAPVLTYGAWEVCHFGSQNFGVVRSTAGEWTAAGTRLFDKSLCLLLTTALMVPPLTICSGCLERRCYQYRSMLSSCWRACLRRALASGDRPALKLAAARPSTAPRQLSMVRDSVRLRGMSPPERRAVLARMAAPCREGPASRCGSTNDER